MSSATVGTHHSVGPLSLMSCVRESSPLQDFDSDNEKNVVSSTSKRRFWNPKRWFRRKSSGGNKVGCGDETVTLETPTSTAGGGVETAKDALRSRSTSELSISDDSRRRSSSSMHPGLSVSHDSVFHSPNSSSEMELDAAQSASSLLICQPHIDCRLQTELTARLQLRRGRGDISEDDEGFPYSSCNSPTTSDGLLLDKAAIKDLPTKSHSTCSDGSLLSMDSYEMDEDLSDPQSRYSSKLSLQEKKSSADSSLEFGPKSIAVPLNHSAAHHRVAVKPKRTHGVPRRRKGQQLSSALPATPELNEDSSVRSISPVVSQKDDVADPDTLLCVSTEAPTETQIKCSSLPAGLRSNPPWSSEGVVQLNRSLSSAGPREEQPSTDKTDEKPSASLFDRIFPRKSGRKKKDKVKEEKQTVTQEENRVQEVFHAKDEVSEIVRTRTQSHSYTHTSINITSHTETNQYSGLASRQRLPPVDIPLSPSHAKKEFALPRVPVEKRLEKTGSSPIHIELENRFKQKQISLTPTSSPTEPSPHKLGHIKPPPSPILPKPNLEDGHNRLSSTSKTTRNEELRSKMKLPGLSALQQRVLLLNDQVDNGFSSLTHFPAASKPLVKSQSFKCPKVDSSEERNRNLKRTAEFLDEERKAESGTSFVKAASLDCVKNLDELKRPKVEKSENWAEDCDNARVKRIEFKKPKRKSKEYKVETEPEVFSNSGVTISGPSHTAVVNVTSIDKNENISNETSSHALSVKEHQVSVTKIHLKHEVMHTSNQNIAVTSKDGIPELGGKQLSKIDLTPTNNLLPSAKLPKSAEEQKSTFNFDTSPDVAIKPPTPRKFSKENLEIVEKEHQEVPDSPTPVVSSATINLQQPTKYKKNNKVYRKSSATLAEFQSNEKGCLKNKSVSLDSLKSEEDKKRNSTGEPVVLRKKSIAAKKEEEPELMKVFARRSLKLKDSEVSSIQETLLADIRTRESDKENHLVEEPKKVSVRTDDAEEEDSTVMYRKVLHNFGQRAVSVNVVLKKQKSEEERRKTEQWKNEDEKLTEDRFFSSKTELIDETKNFRQRKAEWEKRAQLAQMKKTP